MFDSLQVKPLFFFLERLLTTPAQHCPDPGQQRFPSVSFHKWRYRGSPVSARSQPLFPYLRKSAFSLDYKSSAPTHYSVFLLFFLATRTIYFDFEGSLCPLVSFFVFYPPWLSVWRGRGTLNVNLAVMSWLELHKRYFSWTCTFCLLRLFLYTSEGFFVSLRVIHLITLSLLVPWGFPGGSVVKNPPANAGDTKDTGSIPEPGRSPGVGTGNPLQYPCWKIAWTEGPGRLQSTGS